MSVVRFDQEGIQLLTQGVRASCVGGNTGCIGGADYKESNDYRQLSPRFTLGPVPRGPERFCASEGETCYVPAATAVYYGVGDTYFVKQNVTGAVSCSSGTFGGDPAPGRFKDCFANVPSDPYE